MLCIFSYLVSNNSNKSYCNFPPRKKSQVGNERKNRSVRLGNSRAQKVILAHKVLKVGVTKGT